MPAVLCVVLLAYAPVGFLQSEVTLRSGETWSRDFILAPGDSLKVEASCLRQVGSSCGCLGGLGDIILRKGDNVGRAAISEWHGDVVTSAYQQHKPEVVYYSDKGGAFTLSIENHSGHRTNLYSLAATRTPTKKGYESFDVSFKADTSYETTWVDEPVYSTAKDTSYVRREWTDTLYDEEPRDLKSSTTTLDAVANLLGSYESEVNFYLPENSTGKVGFALFTDAERLRQVQEESRRKWQEARAVSSVMAAVDPSGVSAALGIAMGLISAVSNSGGGTFTYYVVDSEGRSYYDAKQVFRYYDYGQNVSNALFPLNLQPGKMYYLKLHNPSTFNKAVVAYQIATTVREPRFENHSETVPVVKKRQVQTGTRRVPRVESNVTPHLPWNPRERP